MSSKVKIRWRCRCGHRNRWRWPRLDVVGGRITVTCDSCGEPTSACLHWKGDGADTIVWAKEER